MQCADEDSAADALLNLHAVETLSEIILTFKHKIDATIEEDDDITSAKAVVGSTLAIGNMVMTFDSQSL